MGERADLLGRRPPVGERPALPAQGVPRHQRAGPARAQRRRGLVHAFGGLRVSQREGFVGRVHEAVQQQPGERGPCQAHHQEPADHPRRPSADPAPEQVGGPVVQGPEPPPGQEQEEEDEGGDEGAGNGGEGVVVGDPHEPADLVLPVLAEPERDADEHDRAGDQDEPRPA